MPTPTNSAGINFTPFSSETILFPNRAAANQFFGGLTVSAAELTTFGVVKKAQNIPVVAAQTYVNIPIVNGDGSVSVTQVVDKASYDALKAAFDALLIQLKSKGIMAQD